jgi:hypothetical protein
VTETLSKPKCPTHVNRAEEIWIGKGAKCNVTKIEVKITVI